MKPDEYLPQIRNGIYLHCAISVVTVGIAVVLNVSLTNRSIAEMRAISGTADHILTNELEELFQTNKIDELVKKSEAVLEKKPLSVVAHFYLGVAHFQSGDFTASRASLEQALSISPVWKPSIIPYLEAIEAEEAPDTKPDSVPG